MKDKSYPSKLAEDLNRLSKIPVGRSYAEEGSAIHQLIATKNARITKLEQTNKELCEALINLHTEICKVGFPLGIKPNTLVIALGKAIQVIAKSEGK